VDVGADSTPGLLFPASGWRKPQTLETCRRPARRSGSFPMGCSP